MSTDIHMLTTVTEYDNLGCMSELQVSGISPGESTINDMYSAPDWDPRTLIGMQNVLRNVPLLDPEVAVKVLRRIAVTAENMAESVVADQLTEHRSNKRRGWSIAYAAEVWGCTRQSMAKHKGILAKIGLVRR